MLWAMFRQREDVSFKAAKNAHGEYLLDRNGRGFEAVLEYLRTGTCFVPPGAKSSVLLALLFVVLV